MLVKNTKVFGNITKGKNNLISFLKGINSLSVWYFCIFIIFIILIAIRIYHLGADPPINLSSSGGLFGDEAALAHNARNKILFGQWITDDWNPIIYNPIFTILGYSFFYCFGVGLVQLRLVNVLIIFFSFILLFLTIKENGGKRIITICLLLLGFNYIFFIYSRLGLNDTFLIFPIVLTLYFWKKGLNNYPILFFAGVSSFACYVTKASAVYFIIATLISLLFAVFQNYCEDRKIKTIVIPIVYFFCGLLISFAMPSNLSQLWKNLTSFTFLKHLSRTPIELIVCWCYAPLLVYDLIKNWKKVKPFEILIFCWLVGGYIAIGGLNYRPLRYFLPLIPPVCILASIVLNRVWEIGSNNKIKLTKILYLCIAFTFWIYLLHKYCIGYGSILSNVLSFLLIALILSLFYFLIEKLKLFSFSSKGNNVFCIICRSAVISVILLALFINGTQYLRWIRTVKYSVIDTSKDLGKRLDHAYIAGLWSPLATIENKHKALYVGNRWFNYKDTFKKYPVTHLFLWDGNNKEELRFLNSAYPEIMKRAKLIKIYKIKGLPVRLYEINNMKE
jgi:4-amino-4-deoxy-L-arabinose transferase-like glycosyltransferase